MKRSLIHGIFSRLGSLLRAGSPARCARVTRTQLNIEALEARLVPTLVAPGASWDDGTFDSYGVKSGVTVSLQNMGSTWLEVSGGGGAASVSPGAAPPVMGGSYSTVLMEGFPGGDGMSTSPTSSTSPTAPVVPAYAFSVTGMLGDGSGDVAWSGAAESLYILATGDISNLSIVGDVVVQAGWTIGDLSGRTVSAQAGQSIGMVTASGDVGELWAGTTIGTVSAGGNITRISAGTTTSEVKAGGWLGAVSAGLDIGGSVKAGLGATVSAAGSVLGAVNAQGGPAEVWALADISGAVHATGDIWVSAWGSVQQSVTSDTGSATVFGNAGVDMAVRAGLDVSVSTGSSGAISGAVTAGRDATVWAREGIDGPVVAVHDLNATSMASIQGSLSAGNAATVWALGTGILSILRI